MSTRCNVIVRDLATESETVLYHHCDGYLSGVGFDLLDYVRRMIDLNIDRRCQDIACWLIEQNDGYEMTDGIHGDIEYLYIVEMNSKQAGMKVRAYEADGKLIGDELTAELENDYIKENGKLPYEKSESKMTECDVRKKLLHVVAELSDTESEALLKCLTTLRKENNGLYYENRSDNQLG